MTRVTPVTRATPVTQTVAVTGGATGDDVPEIPEGERARDVYARHMQDMLGALAATVRLVTDDPNTFRLVASIGISTASIEQRRSLTLDDCLYGRDVNEAFILVQGEGAAVDEFDFEPPTSLPCAIGTDGRNAGPILERLQQKRANRPVRPHGFHGNRLSQH